MNEKQPAFSRGRMLNLIQFALSGPGHTRIFFQPETYHCFFAWTRFSIKGKIDGFK